MTVTRSTLASVLFEKIGLNKRESRDFTDMFFQEIKKSLLRGEPVKLSGFGNFALHSKGERLGRNPKTGEAVMITARRTVKFRPSAELRSQVALALPGIEAETAEPQNAGANNSDNSGESDARLAHRD